MQKTNVTKPLRIVAKRLHQQKVPLGGPSNYYSKTIDFDNGVNITLGLPIIRTSPDHGTALDIAGSGKASEKSLYASIKMSQDIARKRKLWIQ